MALNITDDYRRRHPVVRPQGPDNATTWQSKGLNYEALDGLSCHSLHESRTNKHWLFICYKSNKSL